MDDSYFQNLLIIANSSDLQKFLHECIDDLVEKNKISFQNYTSGPSEWTISHFENAKKDVQSFYKNCVIEGNFYTKINHIQEPIQEPIKTCYDIRKRDIFDYVTKTYILKSGNNLITNIDWRLKWILGTSDLTSLKEPYLQVDLNGVKSFSGKTENTCVSFEASLDQVNRLITELTAIKKELKYEQ